MSRRFFRRSVPTVLDLAARHETGVLEFAQGAFYLEDGAVSQVVSPQVPGASVRVPPGPLPPVQLQAVLADAVADAALDVFSGSDTRFVPGARHRDALSPPLPVPAVLDEIARRRRVLAGIAGRARPDSPVTRASRLPVRRARLTPRQWDLVRLTDGRRTPRALAFELGSGVFETTVDVAALVQAGLFARLTDDVPPATTFLDAARS